MAKLHVNSGGASLAFELGDYTCIGSDLFCDVFIPDAQVASKHAELHRLSDGQYQLVHLRKGSSSYVNGESATKTTLADGDVIVIGSAELRFEDADTRSAAEISIELHQTNHEITARHDATADPEFMPPREGGDLEASQADFRKLLVSHQLNRALGFERDLDRFLERLLDAAFNLFHAERGAVLLVAPDGVTPIRSRGQIRQGRAGKLRLSQSLLREALERREALIATDTFSDAAFDSDEGVLVASVRSMMCAPLIHDQLSVGALHLDANMETGGFTPQDAELLTVFARQAARTLNGVLLLAELELANTALLEAKETADLRIKELHERNDELTKLSIRDPLTGLYNHPYLLERLEEETRRSRRYKLPLSLLVIDIDKLEDVNKFFGHPMGDKVIKFVSDRLTAQSRSADIGFHLEEREIATRYSGDKFIVLLPETEKRGAAVKAERLRVHIKGFDFAALGLPKVTVSIGVASFPDDGQDRAAVISSVEAALDAAKQAGSDQTVAFSPALRREDERVPDTGGEIAKLVGMDRVIHNRAMRYVYQPIVSQQAEIFAYEALCRPDDPAFRNPLELISAAESSGRVCELGVVMRELATKNLPDLAEPHAMFINLHPMELTRELLTWGERFKGAERVVLEVTETAEISDHSSTRELLQGLRSHGFRIALDDLGAGYAGLNSLALLGADFAKLDMAMVRDIHSDGRAARLIGHILDFCDGEGMKVIAEGIETPEEYKVVCELGCHLLQGYLFAKPQPPFCRVEFSPDSTDR